MCSAKGAATEDSSSSSTCSVPLFGRHYDAFKRVACSFCALSENAHAALPHLPPHFFSSCSEQLGAVGVFVNAGVRTLHEAKRAASTVASVIPPANVIISTDALADDDEHIRDDALVGVRVMVMPDDDDGSHIGGYGSDAHWKKAQSRFPHALAAAVSNFPPHVNWIISQDSDTALNLHAIAVLLASHDHSDKIIFGCIYEHSRDARKKAHHGGGAGMIFSRAAALSIVQAWRSNLPFSAPRLRMPFHETSLNTHCTTRGSSLDMWTATAARISHVQLQHLRGMHQQGVHCAFHRDGYATRGTLLLSSHHVREGPCSGT